MEPDREFAIDLTASVTRRARDLLESNRAAKREPGTVTALAERTGIPRANMSNLMNGKRESITVAELLLLADALGTEPWRLCDALGPAHLGELATELAETKNKLRTAEHKLSQIQGALDGKV